MTIFFSYISPGDWVSSQLPGSSPKYILIWTSFPRFTRKQRCFMACHRYKLRITYISDRPPHKLVLHTYKEFHQWKHADDPQDNITSLAAKKKKKKLHVQVYIHIKTTSSIHQVLYGYCSRLAEQKIKSHYLPIEPTLPNKIIAIITSYYEKTPNEHPRIAEKTPTESDNAQSSSQINI